MFANKRRLTHSIQLGLLSMMVSGAVAAQSDDVEEVIVSAHPLSAEGLAQASAVLQGDELARKTATSLGETIESEPGIRSASFGQAVGRPVIHGLAGARVRVMEDRIDTLDASVTSVDHATTVDTFMADRIEILKGASALLYGSGAIGGVVDVHTGRIPHEAPEDGFAGRADIRFDDNGDGTSGAIRLDGGGDSFAWHFDFFSRDADEYEIPGFAESQALRDAEEAEEEEHGDEEEHGEEEEAFGFVPGSQLESEGGAVGLSWLGDGWVVGAALSTIESNYGLPGGHGHEEEEGEEGEEEEEEGNPILDLEQTRFDVEIARENPFSGFSALNIRAGFNDYEHQEIEPSGEIATDIQNEAFEARFELIHEAWAGWEGAIGVQYTDRDFEVSGEEAFVPPVQTNSLGAFWAAQRSFDSFDLEAGLRIENVDHEPSAIAAAPDRDFNPFSVSLGAVVPVDAGLTFGVLLDLSSRAPVAEELYSNGAHLATQSFEIGNVNLDEEQALNFQATLSYRDERFDWAATAYRTDFDDFIYQAATGEEEDGLPLLLWQQDDATFTGFDAKFGWTVFDEGEQQLKVKAQFDLVRAELDRRIAGNDNLPRIPADRHGLGLEYRYGPFLASVDYTRVSEQDEVTEFEFPTAAYDDFSAYLGYELALGKATNAELYLQGKNLTDDEQRNHTSFIKDFAPRPGRSVQAGVRFAF